MIKGIFKKKPFWNIICLFCGLFLIALFIFIGYMDNKATTDEVMVGIVFGLIVIIFSVVLMLFNFKAYLYIENGHIKGRYNYFNKIDCHISDVEFALAQINTLIIQLKGGKRYTIMGVENSFALCSIIRRNMNFDTTKQPQKLIEKLEELHSTQKRSVILIITGLFLMFMNIFITVMVTGGKELCEFSKVDWIAMAIMGVLEIAITVIVFYLGQKTGRNSFTIEKIKYIIRRTIIETKPLLLGKVIKVFTDDDYTGRITLFSDICENSVYYVVQEFDTDYNLVCDYKSEVFEDEEYLPDEFLSMVDITEKILN